MKPTVRQVDGEWRVWVDTGILDAFCKPIYLGDELEEPRIRFCRVATVGGDTSAWESWKVVNSPGIPCEVEASEELNRAMNVLLAAVGAMSSNRSLG